VIKNRFFKEVLKMSSAAAQQASTKAHSNKLSYWTQPNPTHQKLKNLDPTKSNPTQPMGQPNPWITLGHLSRDAAIYLSAIRSNKLRQQAPILAAGAVLLPPPSNTPGDSDVISFHIITELN